MLLTLLAAGQQAKGVFALGGTLQMNEILDSAGHKF